ncbi:hypothetical protein CBM2634_U140008 [Cupriavidus taiwanensis]|uniref:Uncharacterized protein n=1 Tax=Cupriavidus taiwanensis TaxID=164546 RepID=A0A375JBP5_9BURK|nr:hypothetical protein CBM2634_U140008 [Cupriavidus taiwanensis]
MGWTLVCFRSLIIWDRTCGVRRCMRHFPGSMACIWGNRTFRAKSGAELRITLTNQNVKKPESSLPCILSMQNLAPDLPAKRSPCGIASYRSHAPGIQLLAARADEVFSEQPLGLA